MSYYVTDYFKNPPPPYDGRSATRTVPGWGVAPRAAGPPRLGVGLVLSKAAMAKLHTRVAAPPPTDDETDDGKTPDDASKGIPWWVWIAAPGVLAGGFALAVNMGWVGSEG